MSFSPSLRLVPNFSLLPLAEAETLSKQPSGLFVVEGETIVEPAGCRQGPSLIADELSRSD